MPEEVEPLLWVYHHLRTIIDCQTCLLNKDPVLRTIAGIGNICSSCVHCSSMIVCHKEDDIVPTYNKGANMLPSCVVCWFVSLRIQ